MKKAAAQGSILKKTSIAAALGLGIVSTGYISPVMADALSQIPVVGSLFHDSVNNELRSAAGNDQITKLGISDTHEGATLTVAEAYHDGKSLSIALTREGLITNEDRLVGEPVKGQMNLQPIINSDYGVQKNAALLQISSIEGTQLPDQFELTIKAKLSGISNPFEFQVPVSKQ
ncbi:DUF4179 domain-containing protein [Paenibacillus sp. HW567]|uniref:DUF4179 domain-containing protein n=1 Tax=Paenibacillus sp. HW567 TaxID=1034769 RepID=UPI00035CEA68|nr:DUF4179 domain-containing protein [Paenibacillus sp. HW567]